jgi:hydroxypyruvate isomerase
MVFLDLPIVERVRRIDELGFQVEIWDWTTKDIDALVGTGAVFSSMTGYVRGSLADEDGAPPSSRSRWRAASVARG